MGSNQKDLMKIFAQRVHDRREFSSKRWRLTQKLPDSLGQCLTAFFKKDPETLKKIEETKALMAWPEIVGQVAAKMSRAVRFRGATLIVHVQDGLWLEQLCFLKNDVLKRYNRRFPGLRISDIYFKRFS